ncbi:MAG: hypothetical protein JRI23_10760 [Deltaproteobacteria bacterium]|jgi:hypothetical protein|nr:hypothetical protein [Deltaproteobacteria bacterium]MBW2532158.1 hypothetical protein [Deltaproteobacteria bacterium]
MVKVRRLVWLRRFLALCLVALGAAGLGLVAPGDAWAGEQRQSVKSLINKGQDQFDEQMYEESIQTLSAALMRPGIAKKEKIEVYRLLAYNYITLRRDEEADAAVRGLLVQDPEFELPESESPRFRDFFKTTREAWEEEGKPGLTEETEGAPPPPDVRVAIKHASPAQVDAGLDVSITGTVDDPDAAVDKVVLYYRVSSGDKFTSAKVKFTVRKFSAEIPGESVEPPLVEYYLEAQDDAGLPLATRGDAASPLRIAVPDESSWYTSPWFWVPVSAVVVAGIVVAAVVATQAGDEGTAAVTVNVFE